MPEPESYTNEQLCEMAKRYYEAAYGQTPPWAEVDHMDGTSVVIHLFEVTGGHFATWDWYTIDPETGKGYNFSNQPVDLTLFAP